MGILQQLNQDLARIVAGALPSLVQVQNDGGGGRGRASAPSGGAGTVWHADGLVLTNAHVVAPSVRGRRTPVVVLADGSRHRARVVGYDARHDIAALTIDARGLPTIEVGDSAEIATGDWVTAIGHPWGVRNAVTAGTVITVGTPPEIPYDGAMIQVGLHMRPGHSGGAMLNDAGQLVGINCMIAGPNVGLAIPVNTVKRFLKQTLSA